MGRKITIERTIKAGKTRPTQENFKPPEGEDATPLILFLFTVVVVLTFTLAFVAARG